MKLKIKFCLSCFLLACMVISGKCEVKDSNRGPLLMDTRPLTKQNLIFNLDNGDFVRVDMLGEQLFRIRHSKTGQWTESGLNRYGIFSDSFPEIEFTQTKSKGLYVLTTKEAKLSVNKNNGRIVLTTIEGEVLTTQTPPEYVSNGGFDIRFSMAKEERIYGLGDISRENIMRRGGSYEFWVQNVISYIPIPVMMSNRGWGMLMNTTWRSTVDVGKTVSDQVIWSAPQSDLDYYLFCGPDYRSMLNTYTAFSGRPALLPIWGYGLTYVCNRQVNSFEMMSEARTFRSEGMSCDVIGLEPGWMSKSYDFSTDKSWHPERFFIPYWTRKGDQTFFGALDRLGFKLSLWLCCDYDLGIYEEQLLSGVDPASKTVDEYLRTVAEIALENQVETVTLQNEDNFEKDERLTNKTPLGNQGETEKAIGVPAPWFDHLMPFVDQGVRAFKLDGAKQIVDHPNREWGNGMSDEEMHNLYPVIYGKQMSLGFEKQTNQRSMVYSAGGYAGIQKFVASWAGDTGGGSKPLISMLNLGISGHSNHSCDMDVFNPESIHFGFLQTWSQLCNWAYWRQPWYLDEERKEMFKAYDELRYRLLPYIYSTAAEAAQTGYPVMRSMSMSFPNNPEWDNKLGQYMLGDAFLVSAFSEEISIPEGNWIDFWSGERFNGPLTMPVVKTAKQGGALMVKSGAIIPTWPLQNHVEKGWSDEVHLLVYPDVYSSFILYEDDGNSLGYREGECTQTLLTCETIEEKVKLTIGRRQGSYKDMPETRNFTATIHLPSCPSEVLLDGETMADFLWDDILSTATMNIPSCGDKPVVLIIH